MSTDGYTVNPTELENLIRKTSVLESKIEAHLSLINQQVDALHVDWTGQSATAHRQWHARWNQAALDLHAALVATLNWPTTTTSRTAG